MTLSRPQAEALADQLRVLAQPTRLMILSLLRTGERSVGDIERALDLKQPGLSQQLGELRQAGMVATRREAKSIFYRLADGWIAPLAEKLDPLLSLGDVPAALPARPRDAAVFAATGVRAGRL